jgi:peptide/nickel transport system permease protein
VGRYILRRLLIAIPTLLAITFVVFALLSVAPTDPLAQFGADPRVPPEVRANIRAALGLDDPWPIRYVKWLTSLAQGNFGVSFMSHSSVSALILQRLPNTLAVVGVAYLLGVLVGVPAGMLSAVKRYSSFDYAATFIAFVGFSLPTFFVGLMLMVIFSIQLHWLPFIYDSTLRVTDLATLGDQLRQSVMPI